MQTTGVLFLLVFFPFSSSFTVKNGTKVEYEFEKFIEKYDKPYKKGTDEYNKRLAVFEVRETTTWAKIRVVPHLFTVVFNCKCNRPLSSRHFVILLP